MALSDEVEAGIDGVLTPEWNRRNGQVVPDSESVVLRDGAVDLEATYLYADMAGSTSLAQNYHDWAVAKVIRCYLNAASRLIRARGGAIRSFDGDRVMGIFVGGRKNTEAVKAAMNISWAVSQVIQPRLKQKWPTFEWVMGHGVGIDTGQAMLVRGGVRGDNDLVSIGKAPNVAAKLSEERGLHSIYVTDDVYGQMLDEVKIHPTTGENMWAYLRAKQIGGKAVEYYGTNYHWKP